MKSVLPDLIQLSNKTAYKGENQTWQETKAEKEEVNADIAAVWDLITSLENYSWRSDLDRIEILEPGKTFREYTRDGFATTFTITVCKPMNHYEFDMENENIQGHWIGILEQTQRGTMLNFTEKVTAKGVDEALCGNVSCQTAESIYGGFKAHKMRQMPAD